MSIDPQLIDPDNYDFRFEETSHAKGYGCETYYIPGKKIFKPEKIYEEHIAETYDLSGKLDRNTFVKADTLFVDSDLIIENNTTLNIAPGTTVLFEGPYSILVRGTLISEGTPEERILYTSRKHDQPDDYSNHEYCWGGIEFDKTLSTNDSSSIKYSIIEYAKKIKYDDWDISGYFGAGLFINNFSKVTIENNIFRYNSALYGAALGIINCESQINNNLFYENYAKYNGPIACFLYSTPKFYNNTAVNNILSEYNYLYGPGGIFSYRSRGVICNNLIRNSPEGILPQIHFSKEYYTYNNNIEGFSGFNSNIDEDPLFDEMQIIPGMLMDNSSCEDGGVLTQFNLIQPEFDLIGNQRIVNSLVDIGAFEDQTPSSIISIPETTELIHIYPNPANPKATISFYIEQDCSAEIFVINMKGEILDRITYPNAKLGYNNYNLYCKDYASGLYIVQIATQKKLLNGKLLLLK